jgi:ribulose-5-phosphate 4-epimerase/fuculose-1-phosphate aldolase
MDRAAGAGGLLSHIFDVRLGRAGVQSHHGQGAGRRWCVPHQPLWHKAGFVQHSLFHRTLPDAHAIIHTHTTATVAVCSLEGGLQPVNFYACNFMGQLAYHDFEGVTVREEEGARLVEHLGDKRILMLRNHGPVVMGKTLPDAFIKYWALQRACEHQMATMQMGKPIVVPQDVIAVHQRDLYMASPPGGSGRVEFDAMVRKVDQIDKSWRD